MPRVDSNLFIVTPEFELTEFEKGILDVTKKYLLIPPDSDGVRDRDDQLKWLHETANRLLDAAKKELCKGCAANLEGYIKGRQDALKEMEGNRGYKHEGPAIQTYFPSCFHGGPCTNPMHDCINCPRQSTNGINTATGTSTAKLEG